MITDGNNGRDKKKKKKLDTVRICFNRGRNRGLIGYYICTDNERLLLFLYIFRRAMRNRKNK